MRIIYLASFWSDGLKMKFPCLDCGKKFGLFREVEITQIKSLPDKM